MAKYLTARNNRQEKWRSKKSRFSKLKKKVPTWISRLRNERCRVENWRTWEIGTNSGSRASGSRRSATIRGHARLYRGGTWTRVASWVQVFGSCRVSIISGINTAAVTVGIGALTHTNGKYGRGGRKRERESGEPAPSSRLDWRQFGAVQRVPWRHPYFHNQKVHGARFPRAG